ncbi:MAG: STAS domain-containing protein [Chitinophagaceae bacterium]
MHLKIETKEKFHEIKIVETEIAANMTAELAALLNPYLENDPKNIILLLTDVQAIVAGAAEALVSIQQDFYDKGASFVICEVQPQVEQFLDEAQLLEVMNLTPTLSEAWDIVQMEEIEREFFDEE